LRDQIRELKRAVDGSEPVKGASKQTVSYGRSGKGTHSGRRRRVSEPF